MRTPVPAFSYLDFVFWWYGSDDLPLITVSREGISCRAESRTQARPSGCLHGSDRGSFIDGKAGKLLYRGYNIDDLAEHSTYEETVYLLLYSSLPTRDQLADFDEKLKANRDLPEQVVDIIRLTKDAHPMDVFRTAVSALAAFEPEVNDNSTDAVLRKGVRLTAQGPTIVATHARIRDGKEPSPQTLT